MLLVVSTDTPPAMTKPILKQTNSAQHHTFHSSVHFPPSPSLTRTFTTHCSSSYDRSPIVVDTNSCAMPARHCRTYNIDDDSSQAQASGSKSPIHCHSPSIAQDYHPRAIRAQQLAESFSSMNMNSAVQDEFDDQGLQRAQRRRTGTYAAFSSRPPPPLISSLPSLVPDISSESDESSDGFSPSPCASFTSTRHPGKLAFLSLSSPADLDPFDTPTPRAISVLSTTNLAFLPHPASPTSSACFTEEDLATEKARRKHIRRDNRDSRMTSSPLDDIDDGYTRDRSYSKSPSSPAKTSPSSRTCILAKGRERYRRYMSSSPTQSSGDAGCLEGF